MPLNLGGIMPPPPLPNGLCVPLNSGGFVPLSRLENASPSILGDTGPPPLSGKGHMPLNSGIMCSRPLWWTHQMVYAS